MCSQQSDLSLRTTIGFNFYTNNKKFGVDLCAYIYSASNYKTDQLNFAAFAHPGNVYVAMGVVVH